MGRIGGKELGLMRLFLGWNLARFDSFLLVFCSFLVHFGFVFFAFFWSILIVSPYHIMCYSQSARLKIGFVWRNRVLSAFGGISWFAKGGH